MSNSYNYLNQPNEWFEIVSITNGNLILITLGYSVLVLPLISSPLASIGLLLSISNMNDEDINKEIIQQVILHAINLPSFIQDIVANMLIKRCLYSDALLLPKISTYLIKDIEKHIKKIEK
jgi:hypothetical protein